MTTKTMEPTLDQLRGEWALNWTQSAKDLSIGAWISEFFYVKIDPSWVAPYRFEVIASELCSTEREHPRHAILWYDTTRQEHDDWRDALMEARLLISDRVDRIVLALEA